MSVNTHCYIKKKSEMVKYFFSGLYHILEILKPSLK